MASRLVPAAYLAGIVLVVVSTTASFADNAVSSPSEACQSYMAPLIVKTHLPLQTNEFLNPPQAWGTDSGVVVNAFVGLLDKQGKSVEVYPVVDLSASNTIQYDVLGRCKTAAAVVKLDDATTRHVAKLGALKIPSIPYFFLKIPVALRTPNQYAGLNPSQGDKIQQLLDRFADIGRSAVKDFVAEIHKRHMDDTLAVRFSGADVRFIAVDVEQKLINERLSKNARIYFGRFYARALCAWVNGVQENFPNVTVLLYTTPSTFGDYLNYALPTENDCLHGLPVWIARTTSDAGDVIRTSHSVIDKYSQRLCLQSAGNRCILHQYSHRGVLWSSSTADDPHLPHIDLDRLFPLKIVPDSAGSQYVRQ